MVKINEKEQLLYIKQKLSLLKARLVQIRDQREINKLLLKIKDAK